MTCLRLRILAALLVVAMLLGGCLWWPPAPAGTRAADLASATLAHSPIDAGRLAISRLDKGNLPGYGRLRLDIRWPSGPGRDLRGYHAQLIPDSTAQISISVLARGLELATAEIVREAGQATASVTIGVRALPNVSLVATARDASGDAIATGTAAGVTVVRGRVSAVTLVMTSLYIPAILELAGNAGVAGDTVVVTGTNFLLPGRDVPQIAFDGVPATLIDTGSDRLKNDTLTVSVPESPTTGRVVITVDGVSSYSSALFWVPDGLTIDAPRHPWDTGDEGGRQVVFDDVLTVTASNSWVLREGVSGESFGQGPAPDFTSSDAAVAVFDEGTGTTRELTALPVAGTTSCRANLGGLASNAIAVTSSLLGTFHDAGVSLPSPRKAAMFARVADYVYAIGGADGSTSLGSVVRAQVGSDDSLGAFSAYGAATLGSTRTGGCGLVVGEYFYAFGGVGLPSSYRDSVERAPIDADGILGAFEAAPGSLTTARAYANCARLGDWVYVIAGNSGSARLKTVERARVLDGQGNLGPFANYSGTSQLAAARDMAGLAVLGSTLYILGGFVGTGLLNSVETAAFDAAGDLGPFQPAANLPETICCQGSLAIRDRLVLAGGDRVFGNDAVGPTKLLSAPIGTDGSLGSFADPGHQLGTGRWSVGVEIIGPWLYLIGGGNDGGSLASIERARVPFGMAATASVEVR